MATVTPFTTARQLDFFKKLFPSVPLSAWNDATDRLASNGGWIVRAPGAAVIVTIEGRGLYAQFGVGAEIYSRQFIDTLLRIARSMNLNSLVWTTAIGDLTNARKSADLGAVLVAHNRTDIFWKLAA